MLRVPHLPELGRIQFGMFQVPTPWLDDAYLQWRSLIPTQIREEMRHPVDTVDSLLNKSRILIKDPEVRVSGHGKYILVNIKRS